LALTFGLLLLSFAPRVHDNPLLSRSFWGATLALLLWQVALFVSVQRAGMGRSLQPAMRPQHYLQALMQVAVFAYWGYYWRPVYDHVWLLVAQIVFAYTFDMLLAWSRRDRYVIGFGPFPIIFSTNLFLWFRDDWFYLQFLMIAVGFLGKEFVRWQRDGKRVHIFNPSAFSLGLFSLVLIGTNTTDLTWGYEIATTLTLAPSIYLFLFLLGLVVMYFFSITLVSGSAAITLFGLSALYSAWAGVPYFIDSEIPAAVFLGLFLLVTDPSTSPRTPLGKTLFGALYGFGVFRPVHAARGPRGADLLRQAPVRAAVEPGRTADRQLGPLPRRHPVGAPLGRMGSGPFQPGTHGGLDRLLRPNDGDRIDRRNAPRRRSALLEASLRRGPAKRLRSASPDRVLLLRR